MRDYTSIPPNYIDRLIPILEAFALAGMRSTRGYAEVAAGRLAIVKNGRRSFIRESELRRYIDGLEAAQDSTSRAA